MVIIAVVIIVVVVLVVVVIIVVVVIFYTLLYAAFATWLFDNTSNVILQQSLSLAYVSIADSNDVHIPFLRYEGSVIMSWIFIKDLQAKVENPSIHIAIP